MKAFNLCVICGPLFSVLLGCAESNQGCNAAMYSDSLRVNLDPSITEDGDYTIELTGDDLDATCTVTVGGTQWPECDGNVNMLTQAENGETLTELRALDIIFMPEAPGTLNLVIARDGETVVDAVVTPDYEYDEPNGDGCGQRKTGTATATVAP